MAVRIPGRQRTAGLEVYFLDPNTPPGRRLGDTASTILADGTRATTELADQGTAPLSGPIHDTGELEQQHSDLTLATDDQGRQIVVDSAGVNHLRADPLSPYFPGIDDQINQTGSGIGHPPGVNVNIPPPPDGGSTDDPGGPNKHHDI